MIEPVIIIGAPRSGTNMLRDMLVKLDGVETWPCDEINYIWRHGNVRFPDDCFSNSMATPEIKNYIHRQFNNFQKSSGAEIIVEKTCANSLRVDFINEIFPSAKFIYIVRDAADAVGSAKLRWTAELDVRYLMKKVRYVPISDIPYYALRYAWHRLYKLFSREARLASWGPVLPDMRALAENNSLLEVCATQWSECVAKSRASLGKIDSNRVCVLKYEDFVQHTEAEFNRLAEFIGKKTSTQEINYVLKSVSSGSIGKGRRQIPECEFIRLNSIIAKEQAYYGYKLLGD